MGRNTTRFLDTTTMEKAIILAKMRLKTVSSHHIQIIEFFTAEESRFLIYPIEQRGRAMKQLRDDEDGFEVVADVMMVPQEGIIITSPYDHAVKAEGYTQETIQQFLDHLLVREVQKEGSLI